MAEWLRRASQGHEMYSYDMQVMGSNLELSRGDETVKEYCSNTGV